MIKSFGKLSSWICSLPVDYYSSHTSSPSSYLPSLFTNKLRGRLGAAVYCAALRRPPFQCARVTRWRCRPSIESICRVFAKGFSFFFLYEPSSLEPAIFQSKSSVVSVFVPRTFRSVPTL